MGEKLGFGDAVPQGGQNIRQGSAKRSNVQKKLTEEQLKWTGNVLKALKLPSKQSQVRILAGAISGAQIITKSQNVDQNKKNEAARLLKIVMDAGSPPWKDLKKAEKATEAKVMLDLLSLDNPEMTPLKPGANVNTALWITRKDGDNQERASFLCKVVSPFSQVEGVPDGGEVIREAMSGRAASHLRSLTGLDVGMPESHMLEIDGKYLPGNLKSEDKKLVSIQEARPSSGSLETSEDLKEFISTVGEEGDPKKIKEFNKSVTGLLVFDMMTLNVDRHGGNILVGDDNSLIPIDHGGSFPDLTGNDAQQRIRTCMGGRHNVLLKLPNAHLPLDPETAKKLSGMASTDYGKSLTKDREKLEEGHPGQDGMLSDASIQSAQRAARFVKLGARMKPPMSPAAIQSCMASAAHLFGPQTTDERFEDQAWILLGYYSDRQEVVKQVCCSTDADYFALCNAVRKKGWKGIIPGSPGNSVGITDPLALVSILQKDLQGEVPGGLELETPIDAFNGMANQDALLATLANVRRDAAIEYVQHVPPEEQQEYLQLIEEVSDQPADRHPSLYSDVLNKIAQSALAHQKNIWDEACLEYVVNNPPRGFQSALQDGDVVQAVELVRQLQNGLGTTYKLRVDENLDNQPPPDHGEGGGDDGENPNQVNVEGNDDGGGGPGEVNLRQSGQGGNDGGGDPGQVGQGEDGGGDVEDNPNPVNLGQDGDGGDDPRQPGQGEDGGGDVEDNPNPVNLGQDGDGGDDPRQFGQGEDGGGDVEDNPSPVNLGQDGDGGDDPRQLGQGEDGGGDAEDNPNELLGRPRTVQRQGRAPLQRPNRPPPKPPGVDNGGGGEQQETRTVQRQGRAPLQRPNRPPPKPPGT